MAFKSYLIERFSTSHENIYFRDFSALLEGAFNESDGEHVLIGNISCNGHQIDAVFICRGQITVIDFKDYAGELTFTENNPWRMKTPEGKVVFVRGGLHGNPYRQINAYRHSLRDVLESNEADILQGVHTDIDWSHVSGVVLFQRPVIFEQTEIPGGMDRYFHISDTNRIKALLSDLTTESLQLTDQEIRAILQVLDVRAENIFNPAEFEAEPVPHVAGHNLALIKRVAEDVADADDYTRKISFYKTMVRAEQYKESEVKGFVRINFRPERPCDAYPVNFMENESLHDLFLKNQQERFPKDIFIGLEIQIDGEPLVALCDFIPASDFSAEGQDTVNLNNCELYRKLFEKAGLSEDVIEELTGAVEQQQSLQNKLESIKEILGLPAISIVGVSLGLSEGNLVSAQLVSELKKLILLGEEEASPLLKAFLSKEIVTGEQIPLRLDSFVQVTQLNDSQRHAVESAFSQPLSVITGPPGSGKSQVVLNIIANAVVNGYSVLFSSKNNKAVDTVKERMDRITNEPYLIRFGSRQEIENSKPKLTALINRRTDGAFRDVSGELQVLRDEVSALNQQLTDLRRQLELIPETQEKVREAKAQRQLFLGEYDKWLESLDNEHRRLFIGENLSVDIDVNEENLLLGKIVKWDSGFFSRVFFRLFRERGLETSLRDLNNSLQPNVKDYVDANEPWASASNKLLVSGKENLTFLINLRSIAEEIQKANNKYKSKLEDLDQKASGLEYELARLLAEEAANRSEIAVSEVKLIEQSTSVLNLAIENKLHNQNPADMQEYVDYLPVQVWQTQDIKNFTDVNRRFIESYSAVCLTSLSIKNSHPLKSALIDLLVIDEASQCDIASAIPLIARAKRVVVIGDPLQLRHITRVKEYEQDYLLDMLGLTGLRLNYVEESLFDHCSKMQRRAGWGDLFLEEHYRCHPTIAEFISRSFYLPLLGRAITVRTDADQFEYGDVGLNWIHVIGTMDSRRNINREEAEKCINLARDLSERYPDASIGIVTPFKHQYEYMRDMIPQGLRGQVLVDTVHKYQGDEKDIMIFSIVCASDAREGAEWFLKKHNYLINVAVSRARSALYVVGDIDYCRNLRTGNTASPLQLLARCSEEHGQVKRGHD